LLFGWTLLFRPKRGWENSVSQKKMKGHVISFQLAPYNLCSSSLDHIVQYRLYNPKHINIFTITLQFMGIRTWDVTLLFISDGIACSQQFSRENLFMELVGYGLFCQEFLLYWRFDERFPLQWILWRLLSLFWIINTRIIFHKLYIIVSFIYYYTIYIS